MLSRIRVSGSSNCGTSGGRFFVPWACAGRPTAGKQLRGTCFKPHRTDSSRVSEGLGGDGDSERALARTDPSRGQPSARHSLTSGWKLTYACNLAYHHPPPSFTRPSNTTRPNQQQLRGRRGGRHVPRHAMRRELYGSPGNTRRVTSRRHQFRTDPWLIDPTRWNPRTSRGTPRLRGTLPLLSWSPGRLHRWRYGLLRSIHWRSSKSLDPSSPSH